ncbi:MAG: Calx-beta domain-containing protein [Gammaproteobacteria bacterium]
MRAAALLGLAAASALGDVTQQDTVVPNRFEFTQAEYVVAEDASHAVIWVRFRPGHRGISGQVAYRTEDGTALADEDYAPVAGSLYFSGWANRSFNVPIVWDSLDESDQTVNLRLLPGWKTEVGPQATATVRITNVRPPLKLALVAAADGTLTLSWPDDGVARLLEKCDTPFGGNWTVITNAPTSAAGRLSVTDVGSAGATFYRLRKPD